ncbi:MAG: hypothetical protein K0S93_105 [Nitrososphaeraceae archaeon]|nr:hypothetical protein [Nitrososphaeraceae archaeon]
MKLKIILLFTIFIFAYVAVLIQSQNVLADVSIPIVSWNDTTLQHFAKVVPAQDTPLEFVFQSRDENNAALPTNFQCLVVTFKEDANLEHDNIQNGIDLDGNGIGDISQSDLHKVVSDDCGENTSSGKIRYNAAFPFVVPPFQVSEDVSISIVSWNELQVERFGQVIPSLDRPVEFTFQSQQQDGDNHNNKDSSYNFHCVVYRITDDGKLDINNIQNGIDLDGNGIGDISSLDLQQVSSDSCGENISEGQISYTGFIQGTGLDKGTYVFIVTAYPLASGKPITSAAFPLTVPYS